MKVETHLRDVCRHVFSVPKNVSFVLIKIDILTQFIFGPHKTARRLSKLEVFFERVDRDIQETKAFKLGSTGTGNHVPPSVFVETLLLERTQRRNLPEPCK